MEMAKVEILRANGTSEEVEITKPVDDFAALHKLVGCDMFDTVNLRDGRVMLVDDTGLVDGKPRNEAATRCT